jgi:hypothetical protein
MGMVLDLLHWCGISPLLQLKILCISKRDISSHAWINSAGIWSIAGDL